MQFESWLDRDQVRAIWREWRGLIFFLLIMLLFRSAIADWNQVPTGSMKPTILEGDRVLVNKLAYNLKLPFTTLHLAEWATPRRGEIVTFYSPLDDRLLIKRVVGIPGDVVSMRDNQLFVNGVAATYSKLDSLHSPIPAAPNHRILREEIDHVAHPVMVLKAHTNSYDSFGPVQVPAGRYLMLGDNRDHSGDSRMLGFIPGDSITGRAHTIAFSLDYDDYYLPRPDRFIKPLE